MFLSNGNAQNERVNSDTRKFIEEADITQINKNFSNKAELLSGIGEIVSFFPVEAIDLKSGEVVKSLQVDMTINIDYGKSNRMFSKSSWVDISEINELIYFLETYVIPNLNNKVEKGKSTTYVFNSKELTLSFSIEDNKRRLSIYLKDYGIIDYQHYFWTQSQVNKIPELINVLKQIN